MFVKKNDTVIVLSGADKGKKGKVLEVDQTNNRVIVEGVRVQAHHKKPKKQGEPGGIQKTEGPIDASNVQVICPACDAPTRLSVSISADGKKSRVCKKCGKSVDKGSARVDRKAKKEVAKEEKPEKVKKDRKAEKSEKKTEKKA
jgi:large subunit ribosomal protein L24